MFLAYVLRKKELSILSKHQARVPGLSFLLCFTLLKHTATGTVLEILQIFKNKFYGKLFYVFL